MRVSIIDEKEFEKKAGYYGLQLKKNNLFEVIAIIVANGKIKYLINISDASYNKLFDAELFDAELFDIIDDEIPYNWSYKYYGYKNKIKNNEYYFNVIIDSVLGPKGLLEYKDWMFEIIGKHKEFVHKIYDILQDIKNDFRNIQNTILTKYVEIEMLYNGEKYWILVYKDDTYFKSNDSLITYRFNNPKELLSAVLLDNKKLIDLWNSIKILSVNEI